MNAILTGLLIATLALMVQDIAAAPIPQPSFTANEDVVAIQPPASTNAPPLAFPIGTTQFTNLDQVLQVYAELTGKTILRPASLKTFAITLKFLKPLTRQEELEALEAGLALNAIALIDYGNGFLKAVPADPGPGGDCGCPFGDPLVTHISQVTWCKPSDLVPALTPFASMPNGILPIDCSQVLVLRDRPENVKRMLGMLDLLAQPAPPEFISEVIPIKNATASEVANALNNLIRRQGNSTNLLQRLPQPASIAGELPVLGPIKAIADERSNSILIFATRPDLETLRRFLPKLDVVRP